MGADTPSAAKSKNDLEVWIDDSLSFDLNVKNQVAKSNRLFDLIRRAYTYLDVNTMKRLFTPLERPCLVYAVTVWSLRLLHNRRIIEDVFRSHQGRGGVE